MIAHLVALGGEWTRALLVVSGTTAAILLIRNLARRRLRQVALRTETHLDDLVVELLDRTRAFFALAAGIWAAVLVAHLPPAAEALLSRAVILAALVQGGVWGQALVRFAVERMTVHAHEPGVGSAMGILRVLGTALVWAIVALAIFANLGIDVTAGVAGLGIGGVAVALAVQNILGDLFASLSIVLDRPFVIGDTIAVDSIVGTVEHIGVKTTRLRSVEGEQIVLANGDLLKSRIRNLQRLTTRRVRFTLAVTYDTPRDRLNRIPEMIRAVIEAAPGAQFERAHFRAFGPSSLDFDVAYRVDDPDYPAYLDVRQSINFAILERFAAEGIAFAYPTQTVFVNTVDSVSASSSDGP